MRIIGNDPEISRQTQVISSGAITGGKPVVINTDGTVTQAGIINAPGAGTPVVFEAAQVGSLSAIFNLSAAFDSNSNKVVIVYKDYGNSSYGTAIVGTVSGTAISFGTPVVFESAATNSISIVFDDNANKMVIAFSDGGNSSYGKAIVGTVSGTSISFGSVATFESATSTFISTTFDSNSNKVVIAYQDNGNGNYGTATVATVSGTNISFGTRVVFESAQSLGIGITFDSSNNKVIIAYRDLGNSNRGTAIVGTVSGTNISFGSAAVFNTAQTDYPFPVFDSNSNKAVIVYRDNQTNARAIVATVSGTSISFGSASLLGAAFMFTAAFDSSTNKVVVVYEKYTDSGGGQVKVGTVSGTSISFGSEIVLEGTEATYPGSTFDSNSNKTVLACGNKANSTHGTAIVISSTSPNVTSENFIGFAEDTVATGQPAIINTKGAVDENQSSLTAGQQYFVQNNGTLGTTAATPSVVAGNAVSATKLIVKG